MLAHEVLFLDVFGQVSPGLGLRQCFRMPGHHGDFFQHHRVMYRFHRVFAPGEGAVMPGQYAGYIVRVQSVVLEVGSDHPAGVQLICFVNLLLCA